MMRRLIDSIRDGHWLLVLRRRLTEQQAGPLTESNPKGWQVPDPFQQRLRGLRSLEAAYLSAWPISNAVDTIRTHLFGFPQRDLTLETDSTQARELLSSLFEGRAGRIFPQSSYTIHDFLASCGAALALFGRLYYAMVWSDDGRLLTALYRLPEETMKAERRRGKIRRFRQQYSIFTSNEAVQKATPGVHWTLDEEVRGTTFYFAPDEVFFLEWPFDPGGRKGYPPSAEAVKHLKEWQRLDERMLLQARASAFPELEDWRHLRARRYDFEEELRRHRRAEVMMTSPFRIVPPGIPRTPYFDVWQLKQLLQFVGDIRQYLLDQFNSQVVGPILRRNRLDAEARYVCDYKLANQEIEILFSRYVSGDIGQGAVVDKMLRDRA